LSLTSNGEQASPMLSSSGREQEEGLCLAESCDKEVKKVNKQFSGYAHRLAD
jgi:hypothetical protein